MASEVMVQGLGDGFLVLRDDGGGWARFVREDLDEGGVIVRVRFDESDDGRLIVGRLHVSGEVTGALLRVLPLRRLEAAANAIGDHVRHRIARRKGDAEEPPSIGRGPGRPERAPRLRLRVPEGPKRPDSFYEQVADRYQWLAARSSRPADELAVANGVPTSTVHRWVKEARRRELMEPGRRAREEP